MQWIHCHCHHVLDQRHLTLELLLKYRDMSDPGFPVRLASLQTVTIKPITLICFFKKHVYNLPA